MHENIANELTQATVIGKVFFSTIVAVFASLTAYLNINTEALALYFSLLAIDLSTGVMAAFVVKEEMTLSRFNAGIIAKFLMFIVPIVVAVIVKIQGDDLLWFIKWTIVVLAVSEAISITNNVRKATKKKPLPELDAVALIATKLREILEITFNKSSGKK